jgi:hypothetical protein
VVWVCHCNDKNLFSFFVEWQSSRPYILKNIAAVFKITRPPLVLALWKTTIFISKRGAKAIMQEGDMHEG